MGIVKYIRGKIDAERAAYARKRDPSYVRDKTNESILQAVGVVIELKHGQISPERFTERIGQIRDKYESAVVPEVPYQRASKARADNYDEFLGKLIEKAGKYKEGLKNKDLRVRRVSFNHIDDAYTGFRESDRRYAQIEAVAVRQERNQIEYEKEMKETHPQGVKGIVEGLVKDTESARKKAERIWRKIISTLEKTVSIIFYLTLVILPGYFILNLKITGFSISESANSMAGKVIGIAFLVSLVLFILTQRRRLEYSERDTIKLPHANDRFVGTAYDKERDVWIVKYESPRGMAMQAIQDTHVPLPSDNLDKIVYQDIRTGKETGKKAKQK